jgi:hypothetical protein
VRVNGTAMIEDPKLCDGMCSFAAAGGTDHQPLAWQVIASGRHLQGGEAELPPAQGEGSGQLCCQIQHGEPAGFKALATCRMLMRG